MEQAGVGLCADCLQLLTATFVLVLAINIDKAV